MFCCLGAPSRIRVVNEMIWRVWERFQKAVFMWNLIPSRMANLKVKVESGIAENSVAMIPIEVMIL